MKTTRKLTMDDLRDGVVLRHREECTGVKLKISEGRYGDPLLRCFNCAAFSRVVPSMIASTAALMVALPEPAETPQRPSTSFVCSVHTSEPVNWKGRGCRACAADQAHQTAQRQAAARTQKEAASWS